MASQGPLTVGTVADDATIGNIAWTSIANARVEDGSVAQAIVSSSDVGSHYCKGTNCVFSIPSTAIIDGVLCEVKKKTGIHTAGETFSDLSVRLFIGGSYQGDNRASGVDWPSPLTWFSYGASFIQWGLSAAVLNPTNINASTFGFSIAGKDDVVNPPSTGRMQIDSMRITVYYTVPATLMFPFWFMNT